MLRRSSRASSTRSPTDLPDSPYIEVSSDELAGMSDNELFRLVRKLGMDSEGLTRVSALSKILNCAVKVG